MEAESERLCTTRGGSLPDADREAADRESDADKGIQIEREKFVYWSERARRA